MVNGGGDKSHGLGEVDGVKVKGQGLRVNRDNNRFATNCFCKGLDQVGFART